VLNRLRRIDPDICEAVRNAVRRQQVNLEFTASENFVSQAVLEAAGSVLTNKNPVPGDPKPPAVTTPGMGPEEMDLVAELVDRVLSVPEDRRVRKYVREQTLDLCDTFPIYSGLLRRLYEQDRDTYEVDSGRFVSDPQGAGRKSAEGIRRQRL